MESQNKNQISELLLRGNEYYRRGIFDSALAHYQKIQTIDSSCLPALVNIAQCYFELKDYSAAEQFARQILQLDSDSLPALSLMGCLCFAQEKYEESASYFQQALKLDSSDAWNHNYLSQTLQKLEDFSLALDEAQTAVDVSGGADSHQLNFAYALYETALEKGSDFIRPWMENWHKKYPRNAVVNYVYNALQNNPKVSCADQDYVRQVFDTFADSFEEALTELNYQVPQLIADSLSQNMTAFPSAELRILDLGCGTGLAAQCLFPLFKNAHFIGVDLSAGMLQVAAQKNIYNQLVGADLESFLAAKKSTYHLVVAADVLTYFGDLKSIFEGVFSVLLSGGKFIFSVSKNTHNSADWFLHLSGRFQHSENYLRESLSEVGFHLENYSEKILREEGGEPVWGWIVTVNRP